MSRPIPVTRHAVAFFFASIAALVAEPAGAADPGRTQMVIVSFDGAHDTRLWERSLEMGERTGARFTYFLSCTFLMSQEDRSAYRAPGEKAGRSNVGFGADRADVAIRLGHIWSAVQAGHEIANHGCGHFDGGTWSQTDWLDEFSQFDAALAGAWKANGLGDAEPAGWAAFAADGVKGFRAPYLSAGDGLSGALRTKGFAYDASTVSRGPAEPVLKDGVARFALPMIPEGPTARPVIAMDYNLFVRHSVGIETPDRRDAFRDRTLSAFRTALDSQYDGDRVPLQLGFHFVEMNGGAYWDALEIFLAETCSKPDVACVSHIEALSRLTRLTNRSLTPRF